MKTPRAVVFDLGKVLVDFDYGIMARNLAVQGTLDAPAIQHLIDHSPLLFRYESAGMTTAEFFKEVQKATGFRGTFESFCQTFADIFSEIPAMVAFQQWLHERMIPTYIFSNTNELAIEHIRSNFPFFQDFNGYVFSYEQGCMKPQPAIYGVVEQICGFSGSDILYLDDRGENVLAGKDREWRTIWHQSPGATFDELRKLGMALPLATFPGAPLHQTAN